MTVKGDLSLEVFLHLGDICIYVFDDEILGLKLDVEPCGSYRAFNVLLELFEDSTSHKAFPSSLHAFFENQSKIGLDYYLLGIPSEYDNQYGLDCSVKINTAENQVQLKNIKYYTGCDSFYNIDSVSLSFQNAFFFFSNLLLTINYDNLWTLSRNELPCLDSRLKDRPLYQRFATEDLPNVVNAQDYMIAYLQYIKYKLEKKEISPLDLLINSGTTTLLVLANLPVVLDFIEVISSKLISKSNLSKAEEIIYYTFLKLYHLNNPVDSNNILPNSVIERLSELEQELLTDFPRN